ncbi:MAG: lipid A biosynthesis acyltransferase [Proteobacteria bacterium SW_6_67_9]|nr:MAG: lipid A biosynthesis acyltransferase [Proteobacteria bacterium SW_6_67_9]
MRGWLPTPSTLMRGMIRGWSWLPLPVAQAFGGGLGWLLGRLPNRERRISQANLTRCFPERSPQWHRAQLHRSLIETGKTLGEALWLWHSSPERASHYIREVYGRAHLEAAVRAQRGVICATPHAGNWELAGMYCARWFSMTVMFRPPRARWLAEPMHRGRTRLGMTPVPADGSGVRALLRELKQGRGVGILPDQAPRGGDGVQAPFFGIDAATMTLLPRLAQRSGVTVLMTVMERLPRGRGFRAHFWPAAPEVADPDPVRAATALNHEVERCVALAPHQYMWNYKRFRRLKR